MSEDIVARLREYADNEAVYPDTLLKAADKIERLRAELAAERKLKTIYYDEWQDANKENGALREALKPFAQWCDEMELEGPILRDDARVASDITMADVRRARALLNNG